VEGTSQMNSPRTLVAPEAAPVDRRTWTAIDIVRPAIVLLRARPTLDVLLVKDADESDEHVTHLHGVRSTRLPLGRRLAWMRFWSRFRQQYLPEEFLYREARLRRARLAYQAEAVFDGMSIALAESHDPFAIESLTRDAYHHLERCRGRVLIAKVREIFNHVALVHEPPSEPRWLEIVGEILQTDVRALRRRARRQM
jgi:hypothetical protein